MDKEKKDVFYENVTRPQIVQITKMNNTDVHYQVVKTTADDAKVSFICSIARFNNIYVKI
jgi:hypothetical protein